MTKFFVLGLCAAVIMNGWFLTGDENKSPETRGAGFILGVLVLVLFYFVARS